MSATPGERQDDRPAARRVPPAGRLRGHLAAVWRRTMACLPLAPVWGLVMALSVLTTLLMEGRAGTAHTSGILVLFFTGGLLAFPSSVFIGGFLSAHRRAETRFAALLVCLTVLTIAATAFLFSMHYRLFFARWHAPFPTRIWFYQFAFTGAGAFYQFIVMGIRLYMPLGLPALLAMSLWLARMPRVRR